MAKAELVKNFWLIRAPSLFLWPVWWNNGFGTENQFSPGTIFRHRETFPKSRPPVFSARNIVKILEMPPLPSTSIPQNLRFICRQRKLQNMDLFLFLVHCLKDVLHFGDPAGFGSLQRRVVRFECEEAPHPSATLKTVMSLTFISRYWALSRALSFWLH